MLPKNLKVAIIPCDFARIRVNPHENDWAIDGVRTVDSPLFNWIREECNYILVTFQNYCQLHFLCLHKFTRYIWHMVIISYQYPSLTMKLITDKNAIQNLVQSITQENLHKDALIAQFSDKEYLIHNYVHNKFHKELFWVVSKTLIKN